MKGIDLEQVDSNQNKQAHRPIVYVGTHKKYNEGSLEGDWLDIADYRNRDEFLVACAELHSNEIAPEIMFQDWEDIPEQFISASHIDEIAWDWLSLNAHEREVYGTYIAEVDPAASIEKALGNYEGQYESAEDWARDYWESSGILNEIPDFAKSYIDYEQYARDCRLGGDLIFVQSGRWVTVYRNS